MMDFDNINPPDVDFVPCITARLLFPFDPWSNTTIFLFKTDISVLGFAGIVASELSR